MQKPTQKAKVTAKYNVTQSISTSRSNRQKQKARSCAGQTNKRQHENNTANNNRKAIPKNEIRRQLQKAKAKGRRKTKKGKRKRRSENQKAQAKARKAKATGKSKSILEKQSEIESRPGLKPYQSLKRNLKRE